MKLTRDAHLALLMLLGVLGAVVVARWEARQYAPKVSAATRRPPPEANTGQGAALRDGRGMDPNRASAEELELLPSVGPSLARRIVAEREKNGPFRSPRDLLRVKGVGEKTLQKLEPWLRFDSKQVEHAADPELRLRLGDEPVPVPQKAGP